MKGKISLEDLVEQFLDQCRSGNVPDIQDLPGRIRSLLPSCWLFFRL